MTADEYLWAILAREQVDVGPNSPIRECQKIVMPHLQTWGNRFLLSVTPSGSFAKGTANKSGTDIDLFISLSETATETLKQVYYTLFKSMEEAGALPRRQNVSIGIKVNGYSVDLVPAKRQNALSVDHSLYRSKADTWTKTNVSEHINLVANCRRTNEIRVLKLWRNQKNLDFPSFYLELTVIEALQSKATISLGNNVWIVFAYIRDSFLTARVVDPANTNNILSDELSAATKQAIVNAATAALGATNCNQVVL